MSNTQRNAVIGFVVVLVTSLLVAGALVLKQKQTTQTAQTTVASQSTDSSDISSDSASIISSSTDSGSDSSDVYKDGTYQATGSYSSPAGTESIGISVTVQDDVVTATSATSQAQDNDSKAYQQDFISAYSSYVVGKKLSDIHLGVVAGSSLTPNGFNQALETIKQQAKA